MDKLTNTWADTLIAQLIKSGVRNFFIAPGSRSTPLVAAVNEHPLAKSFVHYDERGLGFYALGHAKASKIPSAIIVTSGSALGHLFPAVMEAHALQIPLIILSADRPEELQDCGENQTCDQTHFFGRYAKWYFQLPPKNDDVSLAFITSIASNAVAKAMSQDLGPVHINCLIREPFFSDKRREDITQPFKTHITGCSVLSEQAIETLALKLSQYKTGIFLAGSYKDPKINDVLSTLARRLHWPILSCVCSPFRSGKGGKSHAHYSDMLVHTFPFELVECVFQVGDRYLSKSVIKKLQSLPLKDWILLSETFGTRDQGRAITMQISASPGDTLKRLIGITYTDTDPHWVNHWTVGNQMTLQKLETYFEKAKTFSEYHIFHELAQKIRFKGTFFFGNSLTVRNADAFFYPHFETKIYTSRGISGIDGHIATAAGIASFEKAPLIAIMGDQTFLHDVNSLPLLQSCGTPVLLLVVNNGGGKIFSFLPIKEQSDLHSQFFYNPHSFDLTQAGKLFHIEALHISTLAEFRSIVDSFIVTPRTLLVELRINERCITEEKAALHELLTSKKTTV